MRLPEIEDQGNPLYKGLPEKSTKGFETVMEKEMGDYIADLTFIFGDDHKLNRDVDRALWVYGHLFSEGK